MASAQLQGVLLHLHRLRDTDGLAAAADAELLQKFAGGGQEAAFAVLVRRHGPMVWSVARRQLPHEQDAEDVFQATFLLLARKAKAIRKAESVGSWLHGVAHRLALKLRLQQARRQARERRAFDRRGNGPACESSLADVQTALDVALAKLPEKYRAALVLCYLEGKTQEEAARRLGCPLATLRTRVARGRKLLRDRLAKQGLTLASSGVAALLIASAATATPSTLLRTTIGAGLKLASGQPALAVCSNQVAALVAAASTVMFFNKVKIIAAVLLAAGLLAGTAVVLTQAGTAAQESTTPQAASSPRGGGPQAKPARPRPNPSPPKTNDAIIYAGRVLGPDGKPVAGAKLSMTLAWGYGAWPAEVAELATTAADGHFTFAVPNAKFADRSTVVAATAAGLGAGWVEIAAKNKTTGLAIRLVKDDVPVTGQIIDLEGKPVPGVTVRVLQVHAGDGENLGPWLRAAKAKKALSWGLQQEYLPHYTIAVTPRVTTDAEGRKPLPPPERMAGTVWRGCPVPV